MSHGLGLPRPGSLPIENTSRPCTHRLHHVVARLSDLADGLADVQIVLEMLRLVHDGVDDDERARATHARRAMYRDGRARVGVQPSHLHPTIVKLCSWVRDYASGILRLANLYRACTLLATSMW